MDLYLTTNTQISDHGNCSDNLLVDNTVGLCKCHHNSNDIRRKSLDLEKTEQLLN